MVIAATQRFDLIIVGAGIAGIGLATRLKRAGEQSFVVLERSRDVGGTWRENTYPGVACDIPSQLYSFSFRPSPNWSRKFAEGAEIFSYLQQTVKDEGLLPHIRLSQDMRRASWEEASQEWKVITSSGSFRASALVLACGRLTEPALPALIGGQRFQGPWFHSSAWDHSASLADKRVGVVGSGASAIQLIPAVVEQAAAVTIVQRSAPYVQPREDRVITANEQQELRDDAALIHKRRSELFRSQEKVFLQRIRGSQEHQSAKAAALLHLDTQVQDPRLREKLTPDYEYGCKRVLLSDDYYPAITQSHVTVIPDTLSEVRGHLLLTRGGESAEVDVLIYATGFQTKTQPYASRVEGRFGESLADHWADGMRAYSSTFVHGFPNMFVLNGPNGGLGHHSAIHMIESQVEVVMRWKAAGSPRVEATQAAEDEYIEKITRLGSRTVWTEPGCQNWYFDDKAQRLTLLWPGLATSFTEELEAVKWPDEIWGDAATPWEPTPPAGAKPFS